MFFVGGIFILALVLMFFSGSSELPPEPPEVGETLTEGTFGVGLAYSDYVHLGWAPPYDVFNGDARIMSVLPRVVQVESDNEDFKLDVLVDHQDAFIYKHGYYYTPQGWERFTFPDEVYQNSNWIKNSAVANLSLSSSDFNEGNNFVVAYSCKQHEGVWKCGCSDENVCGRWMLEDYLMTINELPPEPSEPGEVILGDVYLSASPSLVSPLESFDLYARMFTSQDVGDIQNPEFTLTNSKTGEKDLLDVNSDNKECRTYDDFIDCTYSFFTNASLSDDFQKYQVSFTADNLPNVRVYPLSLYANSELVDRLTLSGEESYLQSRRFYGSERITADYGFDSTRIELGIYLNSSEAVLNYVREEILEVANFNEGVLSCTSLGGNAVQKVVWAETHPDRVAGGYFWMSGLDVVLIASEDSTILLDEMTLKAIEKNPVTGLLIPELCEGPSDDELDLENYPEMFLLDNGNGSLVFSGYITVGAGASNFDLFAAIDVTAGIQDYDPEVIIPNGTSKFDSKINVSDGSLIAISTGCANSHAQVLLNAWGYDCSNLLKGMILLGEYDERTYLVVAGETKEYTRLAAKVLLSIGSYDLSGMCMVVEGNDDLTNITVHSCDESVDEVIDLSSYPDTFISEGGSGLVFSGHITLGSNANSSDTLAAIDIATGIRFYDPDGTGSAPQIEVGTAKLDTEINWRDQPVIAVSTGCINENAEEILLEMGLDCSDLDAGIIALDSIGSHPYLVVAGKSAIDARRAARVLGNYEDYDLEGTCMVVTGTDFTNIQMSAC